MTIGAGGSLRQVRLGNVEAAHKNRIVAIGKTTSSLNSEIMAQLRSQNGSGDCAILMVNAPLMAEPSRPRDHWGWRFLSDLNSTYRHPTPHLAGAFVSAQRFRQSCNPGSYPFVTAIVPGSRRSGPW
jgi:hypothetical protein